MKKLVVSCWLLVVGVATAAFGENAAFARATGASMRLDTRQGVRLAAKGASETITYSPRWGTDGHAGRVTLPGCTVTADGVTLKTASEEGEVMWSPESTGAHTLTHAAGDLTYSAQFTVLGDDVAQHAGALAANETWGSNLVHLVTADVTVPSGKTLTIEPDAVVKFMTGTSLTVNGTCAAYGVIFTHVNDDTVGGDTLMDGDAAKPVVDGYKLTGNIYEDDATEERYTVPQTLSSSVSGTVRLKGHKVYLANSSITVNSGATLTLLPGAIIKFASGCSMTVNGTLDAQGTRAAPIVFTSQKDDDWGGDTNGDDDATKPEGGNWTGLYVNGTANLTYCIAMYAAPGNERGNIECKSGGRLTMNGCTVAHSLYDGVWNWGGTIRITNSIFFDCGNAVCPYQGSTECDNCVMFECNYGYMDWSHWVGGTFKNCIFYGMGMNWSDTQGASEFQSHSTIKNCCFYNPEGYSKRNCTKDGVDGCLYADPKFVDPDNGDFRITADSPCVDAGDGTVAPEVDYYGQPRMDAKGKAATGVPNADGICPDIGIYEVQGKVAVPVADLAVVSVTAPSAAVPGEETALTYVVTNRGTADAVGMVRDRFQLKGADAALGGQTVAAGEAQQLYSLAAGAAATFTARVKCPTVKSGNWTLGVTVNAERDVFEQVTANNIGWATAATQVSLPSIAAGSTQIVTIPANGSVGMAVSGMPHTGGAAVMTLPVGVTVAGAVGYVPEAGRFDVAGVALVDGRTAVLLPAVPQGETVYLSFDNVTGSEVSFGVTALTTQEGLEPAKPTDVPVTKKGPNVETKLILPSSVRDGRIYTAWVEYANTGDEEAELPIFTVSRSGGGTTLAASAKGPFELTSLDLIGLAPSAPRGKLKPGEAGKVAFFFLSQGTVNIKLSVVTEKSTSVLNGFATIADYRAGMSAAATRLCLRGGAEPDFTAVLAQTLNEKRCAGGAAVCGTLRHAVTKLPLEGYVMTLVDTNDMVAVAATKTDANGAFALATTEKGDYAVRVQDVQRHDPALVSLDNVDLTGSLLFAVPLSSVGGTLLAGDTALAATAVRVVLDNVATERVGDWTVQTDEAGRFSFGMVPDGNYVLAADGWEGYCPLATEVFLVTNGVACAKDLVYTERGGRVFGKGVVRDEGGTVTNGVVEFVDCASRTRYAAAFDLDGSFAFEGLPAGEYSVCADVPGYYPAFSETVSVAVGSSKGDVELAFVKTPVFTARHPVGMSSVTTAFELMVEATDLAWDFNGDGVTDSTQTTPSYTFDSVGEHDVTLTYTDTNGVRRVSVYPRCVMVVDEIEPTLQPNAVLLTDGCGVVTESVRSNSLVLVGAAVAGYAVGDVVGYAGTAQGGGYVMRICAKRQEGGVNRWVLDTEVAELKDLYKTYFFVSDFEFTAPQVEKMFNSALKGKALKAAVIGKPDTFVKEATWASVPISLSRDYEYFGGNASFSLSGQFVHNSKPIVGSYSEWVDSSGRRCRVMYKKDSYTLKLSPEVSLETDNLIGGKHLFSMPLPSFRSAPAFIPYGFGLTINASVDSTVDVDVTASGTLGFDFEVGAYQSLECVEVDGVRKEDRMMDWGFTKTFGAHMSAKVGATVHLHAVCGAYLSWLDMIGCVGGGIKVGGKLGVEQNVSFANVYDKETHGLGEWDSELALTAELYACLSGSVGLFNLPAGKFARLDVDTPWKLAVTGNAQFEKLDFNITRIDETAFFFKSEDPKVRGEGLLGFLDGIPLGVKSRSWNFGDGIGGVGESLDHRYAKAGSYDVKLTENCAFPTTLVPLGDDTLFTKIRRKTVNTFDDKPPEPQTEAGGGNITPAKSCDPNEMDGPVGAGDPETERFVKPGEWMDYTIYFENKQDADVPAQEVFVDAQLNEWLDWSTFEMGEVAFNNQNETVLAGLKNGMKTVAQNGADYKVQLSVAFDEKTGAAHWYLRSYDPSRSDYNYWPAAVDAGFLPPNDETHRGEGHITYRVKVREDAPKGVKIDAAATIVFDQNDPIQTDPSWWNTVAQMQGVKVTVGDMETTLELIVGLPYGTLPDPGAAPEGYSFGGWFTGPNGTGRQITADSLVWAGDTGLYQYWKKDEPPPVEPVVTNKITYVGLEGAANPNPVTFTTNDLPLVLGPAEREGYRFLGWTPNGGVIPAGTVTNVTFAAQWERLKYAVDVPGVVGERFYGDVVTAASPLESIAGDTNLVCVGWVGTGDVPATGVGTQVTFTVTQASSLRWVYETNYWFEASVDGQGVAEVGADGFPADPAGCWVPAGTNVSVTAVADEHWHFVGWTDAETGAAVAETPELAFVMNGPVSLVAGFAVDVFTVTFDLGEFGTRTGGGELVQTVAYGQAAVAPELSVAEGHSFVGWDRPFDAVEESLVVTARYDEMRYAIAYMETMGCDNSANPADYSVADGRIEFHSLTNPPGWRFVGWDPAAIEAGALGAVTVTAQWERLKYAVDVPGVVGERFYGDVVTAASPLESIAGGTNLVCVGWTGTGDVPATGVGTQVTFTVTQVSSLRWHYETNYWFEASVDGQGVAEVGADGFAADPAGCWVPAGTNVSVTAVADEHWHFVGWTDAETGAAVAETPELAFVMNGPVSLVANFAVDVFTVTFDLGEFGTRTGGGELVQTVAYGQAAVAPELAVAEGHLFVGWDRPFVAVEDDLVVTARYDEIRFAITYVDTKGCDNSANPTDYTTADERIEFHSLTNPPGWRFVGWDPAAIEAGSLDAVTVTAQWEHVVYEIDVPGIEGGRFYGDTVTATTFAEKTDGHTKHVCVGWTGTGDVPATGVGTQVTFTVTQASSLRWVYETNYWFEASVDGQGVAEVGADGFPADPAGCWVPAGTNVSVAAVADEHWHFVGWTDAETGAAVAETPELAFVMNGPVSLVANFAVDVFTVTFDLGEFGTRTGGGELVQTIAYGQAAVAPEIETAAGYTFTGWDEPFDCVTENLDVFAQYEEAVFKITYADTFGCDNSANPDNYTISDAVTFFGLADRSGWRFVGWDPAGIDVGTTGDLTVKALWEEIPTVIRPEEVVDSPAVEKKALTYVAYLYDAKDGALAGTVQVTAGKGKRDKKTNAYTSKVSVSIQLAGETKKVSISGTYDLLSQEPQTFASKSKPVREVTLRLGANGVTGSFEGLVIGGVPKATEADDYEGVYTVFADEGQFVVTVAKKGTAKLAGVTAAGKSVSVSTSLVSGERNACVPVVVPKLGLAFTLWLEEDGVSVEGLSNAVAGEADTLVSGAAFQVDATLLAGLIGDMTYADYFPCGLVVRQNEKNKWIVADGAKAGSVTLNKDGTVNEKKAGENPSALKLTYTAKKGTFTGSFKAYYTNKGKPKAVSFKVTGVLVGGVGYGRATATVNKQKVSLGILVE